MGVGGWGVILGMMPHSVAGSVAFLSFGLVILNFSLVILNFTFLSLETCFNGPVSSGTLYCLQRL